MSKGRHANSPSGPGKPTAVETSVIKEEEGIVELTSKDDAPGGPEGAGVRPPDVAGDEDDSTNED
ncbi:hypothetical protein [Paraburkholderia kirstenboschensis]|jgi:hypothetical protein|uniref:MARCKS-like protein n=1 Tax=Paraburkholderia kirstenboschensis TaxID=1245436 RepID=A0ABZ0E9Q1_9BURK|nr:hypothetical protein [Paraburkholderia kirstenboschensis]WOD13991.1 hypothetical protein RW095_00110 [Paraburkholderia kirstenboschensis]